MENSSSLSILDDFDLHLRSAEHPPRHTGVYDLNYNSGFFDVPRSPGHHDESLERINWPLRILKDANSNSVVGAAEDHNVHVGSGDRCWTQEQINSHSHQALGLDQGVQIMATRHLPDQIRSIFPYTNFNAIQSKCFSRVYESDENFVLSSPTGSGKTVILELAICRLLHNCKIGEYKIVYQGLTKSLCAERQRDWEKKFTSFGLKCTEFTGDTEQAQISQVRDAGIIITTPEKWDSMTRKWKDHAKLMQLVKLFLIDEVHMLRDERGATLEAVVSRMKSVGSDVRFIALSATVPNADDVASWLGMSGTSASPAFLERFGQEFRPVRLEKHVIGVKSNTTNAFAFDKVLDSRLTGVIIKYSKMKPIMVFCSTRKTTVSTAKLLANWWAASGAKKRYWNAPTSPLNISDGDLKACCPTGVAFHHAGLDGRDRAAVEKAYLGGDLGVICCTSTLAVGVNLPCHLVIIKGTMSYRAGLGMQEMSELDLLQMLGRAGRPQFDTSAIAVIMTRHESVNCWKQLVSGEEVLESRLHNNLIEHLNSEIVLGTINNLSTAKNWLKGTFLFTRLQRNPQHYQLSYSDRVQNPEELIHYICESNIKLLQEYGLVSASEPLRTTAYGDAVARYYVQIETARLFLNIPNHAKISEILSALCQAVEFRNLRFKPGEKAAYRELNKSNLIRFPIPTNVEIVSHKVSLIIQSVLGGVALPTGDDSGQLQQQFFQDCASIWHSVKRLIRCIIDFGLETHDSIAVRNGLMVCRSISAEAWDDGPLQMKQIEGIGIVSVRKLSSAGIRSLEMLEATEPHKIEYVLKKASPYGRKILDLLKGYPKLRISIQMLGRLTFEAGKGAKFTLKAEIAFMNDTVPIYFARKQIYAVLLAETSDGREIFFMRISAKKLGKGQEFKFPVHLTNSTQSIVCYVMCDEIAGSMRSAIFKPTVPSAAWPAVLPNSSENNKKECPMPSNQPAINNRQRSIQEFSMTRTAEDEYGIEAINDSDILRLAEQAEQDDNNEDDHIDDPQPGQEQHCKYYIGVEPPTATARMPYLNERQQARLPNGRYKCRHLCKDKTKCKHLCCREGLDEPPKVGKKGRKDNLNAKSAVKPKEIHIDVQPGGRYAQLDLTRQSPKAKKGNKEPSALKTLHVLHEKAWNQENIPNTSDIYKQKERSIITENRENRNQPEEGTGSGMSKFHNELVNFDEVGFKDLEVFSDTSNHNEKDSPKLSEVDKELTQDGSQEENTSDDLSKWSVKDVGLEEMEDLDGFADYVDWEKDYVPLPVNERTIDDEDYIVEDRWDQNPGVTLSTASRSKKRVYDQTEGMSPFIQDSFQQMNKSSSKEQLGLNKLATKRSRFEDTDPISRAPDQAATFCQSFETLGGANEDIEAPNIKETSPSKQNTDSDVAGVDLEWLVREYGSCVEFV